MFPSLSAQIIFGLPLVSSDVWLEMFFLYRLWPARHLECAVSVIGFKLTWTATKHYSLLRPIRATGVTNLVSEWVNETLRVPLQASCRSWLLSWEWDWKLRCARGQKEWVSGWLEERESQLGYLWVWLNKRFVSQSHNVLVFLSLLLLTGGEQASWTNQNKFSGKQNQNYFLPKRKLSHHW